MAKYLKENSEVLEAFMFSYLKLDEFFKAIIFRLSAEEKSVEISFPFEEQESIKAFSGDYLVRGEEIPRSIPTRYRYYVISGQEFCKKFKPLDVKEQFSSS